MGGLAEAAKRASINAWTVAWPICAVTKDRVVRGLRTTTGKDPATSRWEASIGNEKLQYHHLTTVHEPILTWLLALAPSLRLKTAHP